MPQGAPLVPQAPLPPNTRSISWADRSVRAGRKVVERHGRASVNLPTHHAVGQAAEARAAIVRWIEIGTGVAILDAAPEDAAECVVGQLG